MQCNFNSLLGTALLVSSKGDNDLLWVISNDTFPTQPRLIELHVSYIYINIFQNIN